MVSQSQKITANQSACQKLAELKLDTVLWEEQVENFKDQLETIRFATFDNFRALKATDNFIEKYLPFQTQNMISSAILSFVRQPLKAKSIQDAGRENLTEEEMKE